MRVAIRFQCHVDIVPFLQPPENGRSLKRNVLTKRERVMKLKQLKVTFVIKKVVSFHFFKINDDNNLKDCNVFIYQQSMKIDSILRSLRITSVPTRSLTKNSDYLKKL